MELTPWKLPSGPYTMEVPSWTVHYGNFLMEHAPWKLPHCTYIMEVSKWNVHNGRYLI